MPSPNSHEFGSGCAGALLCSCQAQGDFVTMFTYFAADLVYFILINFSV